MKENIEKMIVNSKESCSGCSACAGACPQNCISMIKDEEGFLYPKVDSEKCIDCHLCVKICANRNSIMCESSRKGTKVYSVINKTEDIRIKSSSGGIFTALASEVLRQKGVVFGAAFNESFEVVHKYIEREEDLYVFRGSKYVQSVIGNSYKEAESFLKEKRLVLFTGTPCQIVGLYAYLRKSYDNLITQDIICHGVPSPLVWEKYIEYRERKNGGKVSKISFRNKALGWKDYSIFFSFQNGKTYLQEFSKDPYMQVFLRNLCLRPSCYDCAFKAKARPSDITLADFWGCDKVLPEMDDNKGTSLVFIHSDKGRSFFFKIKDLLTACTVDMDSVVFYNSSMIQSATKPKERNEFMSLIQTKPFKKMSKFYKITLSRRLKNLLLVVKNKFFHKQKTRSAKEINYEKK
jgi:coenzyme F420-reducing hydrogenase beta subunit